MTLHAPTISWHCLAQLAHQTATRPCSICRTYGPVREGSRWYRCWRGRRCRRCRRGRFSSCVPSGIATGSKSQKARLLACALGSDDGIGAGRMTLRLPLTWDSLRCEYVCRSTTTRRDVDPCKRSWQQMVHDPGSMLIWPTARATYSRADYTRCTPYSAPPSPLLANDTTACARAATSSVLSGTW